MQEHEVIGKLVIVGLSRVDAAGTRVAQTQLHGRILRVSEDEGMVLELPNGDEYHLPPDLSVLQNAPAGEFTESSTGTVIADPDFLAMWEIHQDPKNPEAASWKKGPKIKFPGRT